MPKEGGSGSESGGGNSGSVTATGKGTTLSSSSFPKISVSGLKYADLDGDGTADGIIVADISKDSTDKNTYKEGNPWGSINSDGSFSYTQVTSGLKEYSENTYKYTNADGSTVDGTLVKCTNNTETPRYYILSLADYDTNIHYWYKEAYGKMSDYSTFTSKDFGKGKENTEKKMIERMKNHSDSKYNGVDYGEPTTGENAKIEITGESSTVAIEGTLSLTAGSIPDGATVTWASSDTSKATVSNGTVTGVAAGTVTITASATGYKTGSYEVTVAAG